MSAIVMSEPAAYFCLPSAPSQTLRYCLKRFLNMSAVGACGSLERTTAKIEPIVGVMSVEPLISACHIAARAAPSFGMNLPDFSAQYTRIALDCDKVIGLPPGPSWSTITGTWPLGFSARNCGVLCSRFSIEIGWKV